MLLKDFFIFIKKVISLFLFLFNPRKQAVETNLEKIGITKHKRRLAFQTYYNLFNAYFTLFLHTVLKKSPKLIIHNEEYIKEGKIFVSIHYGPWDMALRLVRKKYPFVSVVGKRDFLSILREKHGLKIIYSTDGFGKIVDVAKHERVAIMLDRTFNEKGLFIPVGRSCLKISRAATILARRLREDMFFITAKDKESTIEIFIDKIPYGSFQSMVEKIKEHISVMLLNHPEYWFNFFAKWKQKGRMCR